MTESRDSAGASNTATISWTGGSDSSTANTSYDCYIPTINKTAAGTYDERHEWTVDKTVTPLEQGGYPGDVLVMNGNGGMVSSVRVAEEAARCEPEEGRVLTVLGVARYRVGDYEAALAVL